MKNLFVYSSIFFLVLNLALVNISAETDEASTEIQKQKDECAKSPNKAWDTARNRCMITEESKAQKNSDTAAGKECLNITDLEKRKACFLDYANKNADVSKNVAGESGTRGLERGVTTAYSVLSMIQMFGSGSASNCTSKTIFGITSMAGTLTDLYMKVQVKKKLKSLQDKYSVDLQTNAYDAQVKALEYLKDEQIELKDIANQEKKRNMVMMSGYAAAAGVAAYEIFSQSKCADGPEKAVAPNANAVAAKLGIGNTIGKIFGSPEGILTMSLLSLGLNTKLMNGAQDQIKENEANIGKIQKLIDVYKNNFAHSCPNGRDDLKVPDCYCYTGAGVKNTNRTNSDVCKTLWTRNDFKLDPTKGNYSANGSNIGNLSGCMTANGVFDEECKCKRLTNDKGENACMKASQVKVSIPSGLAEFTSKAGLSNIQEIATMAANGNGDLSKLNGASLAINAANAKNSLTDLLNTNKEQLKSLGPALDFHKNSDLALKGAASILGDNGISQAMAKFPKEGLGDGPTGKLKDSIKAIESDLKKNGIEFTGGNGLFNNPKKSENGFKFSMNDGSAGAGQVLDLPEDTSTKKYKITADIHKNADDTTIFQILSNRYLQSGVKRLMGDEAP